ncbi:MAG: response regulator [Alphaproteobacteria bacterium]|jgi:signal transduction histidine kinase/CheY-like chemotaxis protein/HPt (histidine-containing phosphotransfer) domain-containing protein
MNIRRYLNISVRAALWTLLAGSVTLAATLLAMYNHFSEQARTAVEHRAAALANAVDASASILGESPQLQRLLQGLGADADIHAMVIIEQATGRILASTDQSLVGTTASPALQREIPALPTSPGAFTGKAASALREDGFMHALPLNVRDAGGTLKPSLILVKARTDNIHAEAIAGMTRPGTIMMMGMLLTLALYVLMLHTSILKPLTRMQQAIRRFSRGDTQVRVPPLPRNEVGQLGEKLNHLLDGVVEARARVELQNRELLVAKEEADRANNMKSDFLATISHEIRTPLNGIIGMAQLLTLGNLPPKQAQFSRVILTSAETLLTMINDILDLSKIEAGKVSLETVTFSLQKVLAEAADLVAPKSREKKIAMLLRIAPDVADVVKGDPHRLRQVVLNLASNAVKFTSQGHVCISVIRAGTSESGEQRVKVSVWDTGIGIAPEVQKRLFTKFTQADSSTTRTHGGTGLGLSICHQLVTLMQGEIGVNSKLGEGSEFWFELDLPEDRAVAPVAAPARELAKPDPVRVLVLEGIEDGRTIAAECIAHAGGRCFAVADTLSALRLLRPLDASQTQIDVVVVAETMLSAARADGVLQVAEDLGLPMVLWSNALEIDARELPPGLDLKAVVPRPSLPQKLIGAIAAAMRSRRAPPPPLPARETPGNIVPTEAFRNRRILVVDDNRNQQVLISRFLEMLGSYVAVADDGRAGIETWETGGFDIIVMDCQMPGMNGFDATKAIRQKEQEKGLSRIPIVALTAHVMRGDRDRCLNAGMDDYLTKPMNFENVKRVLAHHLSRVPAASQPPAQAADQAKAAPVANANGIAGANTAPAPVDHAPARLFRDPAILVVEDSEVNCEVAIAMLEMMGCRVVIARSGKAALELCRGHRFDAILMDVQMPEMDGCDTAIRLRQMFGAGEAQACPIIAMTANTRKSDRGRCAASGMEAYVEKPIDQRGLARTLRQWLPPHLHAEASVESWIPVDEAIINPVAIRNVRNLMRGRFDSYARLFLRETSRQLEQIRRLVASEGPADELVRAVHTLRSSCGQIGANRMCTLASSIEERAIERAARNEPIGIFAGDVEKLRRLLADVEAELLRQVGPDRGKATS